MYSFLAFTLAQRLLRLKLSIKQSSNIVSGTHAAGAIVLCKNYFYNKGTYKLINHFSTGYFLYDILHMLTTKKLSLLQGAYIYHHLAAITVLNRTTRQSLIAKIIFWAELSNLPSYPLYYYLHKEGNYKQQIFWLRLMQKCLYISIRVPLFSKFLYDAFYDKTKSKTELQVLAPVYLMGIIWSFKIITQ